MSGRFWCGHCLVEHLSHGEIVLRACGCDGLRHDACEVRLAPKGTPRPVRWPAYLTWRTES